MHSYAPHHIIAIGASAGGMEEINLFFDHTPLDGVAYIVIQHLSPDFKSRMVELLSRHSELVVEQAEEGMQVVSNHVYLIPNDKFMTIRNRCLHFTDKAANRGPHLTINTFFNSLAKDIGNKAIGVVLSGLGSDGTEGITAIKKSGGMIIARNPQSTEFGSMPKSAIATGQVDFVLEPEEMPQIIEDYVKNEHHNKIIDKNEDDKYLPLIIDYLKNKSPLDFSDYKSTTIFRRTKRRAENSGFNSLKTYLDFLKANPDEVDALSKEYLISVTSFFRDKEAYQCIQNEVIPNLIAKLAPDEELKLWVAGCATGEEAYSLAIIVYEQLRNHNKDVTVKIFSTDIDNNALLIAGKGIYSKEIAKDVSPERLEDYFIKEGDTYRIKPEIRRMVIFAQHDIVKNPPYCNMQFISCRNLLIYMTPPLQQKIYTLLLFGLRKDGYLFLGSSENPIAISESLEIINKKWKIYRNLQTKRVVRFDAFSLPVLIDKTGVPKSQVDNNTAESLAEVVNTTYLHELNHLLVCIDENHHVVKTYGDTTNYLLQKILISNFTELLPRPLAVAFNTLISNVIKTNERASVKGIQTQYDKFTIKVNLSVSPLILKRDNQKLFLVAFSEDKQTDPRHKDDKVFNEKIYLDQYTLNLEEELKELKDKMHSVHLQLDASNENMQSFNEELLSANEEMQSSNEEMQSVNEELHTINSDYQSKNKELAELNDDLNNYFRSNINGQLFVNNDLMLMRFSPGTVKQINLLPSDICRPLSNISTNIKFETFTEDLKKVIANGIVITKEIESNDGKWYQIMTMPYLLNDNTINGAVITFNDITQLKKTQQELDSRNTILTRINEDLDNFVHTASHDLLGPLGNIEGSIGIINKRISATDPELSKFLKIVNLSVKKFRTLIKDISVIGKVENEMIASETVDLGEVLDNIEWSLDDKIKESGAVIKRDIEVNSIQFSKKNLRSILYNLISNAIKFTLDKSPLIIIGTRVDKDCIILSVQDNGIGIPPEDQKQIFNMYGRLHANIEGQGIGLSLAKKIINSAGGSIGIESEPGKGTKFIICLKAESEI